MHKWLDLKLNARIPLTHGGISQLTYLGEADKVGYARKIWVRCECGTKFKADMSAVRLGRIYRCSACSHLARRKDKRGRRYGRLTVIDRAGPKDLWRCRCDCGAERIVGGCALLSGNTKSCGCYSRDATSDRRGSNYTKGTTLGAYTIIKRVPSSRRGQQRYLVRDHNDGKKKIVWQQDIKRMSTSLGRFIYKCRSRLRALRAKKNLRRTRSATRFFKFTARAVFARIGPDPGPGYHLDHICPLDCARTEAEAFRLCHPSNLQWLPGPDNLKKSNNWTPAGAALHLKLLRRRWPKPEENP